MSRKSSGPAAAAGDEAPRLVVGTAGHIDHGKTALVRALTGVETDRLPEEQARGITIDLGFAPLDLEGGLRVGVVDVPGHERLVRTMVAGAVGIDLLLLVVAADEGVMPQTREHLAICELLGLRGGLVALSKSDLVDPELAELAAEEVRELLADGPLADAPILPVSSQTGAGIDALRAVLARLTRETPPRTPRRGPSRLAVDRSFEMKGFGSVVTGTLVGGTLSVGDSVEVLPGGSRGRIRGVQSHGEDRQVGAAGQRCALNLQGISLEELSRGQTVTLPGCVPATRTLDVELHWLASAPRSEGPTAASFLVGTAEHRVHVAPIGGEHFEPGERAFARVHIEGESAVALPGDRFVLRGFSRTEIGATLGGGSVLDIAPPHRRRSDPGLREDLEKLAGGACEEALEVRILRGGLQGASRERLRLETGFEEAPLDAALETLCGDTGPTARAAENVYVGRASLAAVEQRLLSSLDAFHAREPLQPGMPTATLRGALPENVLPAVADFALSELVARNELELDGKRARRPDHRAQPEGEEAELAERLCDVLREAALDPPALRDLAERLGAPLPRLLSLLTFLERSRRLVRAGEELFFDASAVDALRNLVRAHFAEHETLDTPTYKTLIGTTRRTAVPLMELFDAEHLTVRRDNVRRLLRPRGQEAAQPPSSSQQS